jgi:hypothetical protein
MDDDSTPAGSMPGSMPELDDATQVLLFAREQRRESLAAEARLLQAAVVWADQHPAASLDDAAWLPGAEVALPIAGPGAPLVAEFCITEFAAALGMSTDAGRHFLGQAVELRFRLPKLWARVVDGQVPAWRARRIAETTLGLTMEAAGFVDAQIAPFAHKVGATTAERLVEEAIARFMPDLAREKAQAAADGRHLDIDHHQVSFDGTSKLAGELDLADAIDLDAAIAAGAEALKAAGCAESLAVRRAKAAGELARAQLGLALNTDPGYDAAPAPADSAAEPVREHAAAANRHTPKRVKPRQVVIYAHLAAEALTGCRCGSIGSVQNPLQVARLENHRRTVTAEQVRDWCGNPDTQVVINPVIDLAEQIHVASYEIPNRMHEQARLRDATCVFPFCERPARRCDTDHVIAYPDGPTATDNLAPLCRRHHRAKTHAGWRYVVVEPGTYLWRSPHDYRYLRDHTGTRDVTPGQRGSIRDGDAGPPIRE